MFMVKTIIGIKLSQLLNIFNIRVFSQTTWKRKTSIERLIKPPCIYINTFISRKIHYLRVPQNINRKGTSMYVYTYMYIVSSRHVTFDLVSQRWWEKGLCVTDVLSSLWVHLIRLDRVRGPYFLGSPFTRFARHRFICQFFIRRFVYVLVPYDRGIVYASCNKMVKSVKPWQIRR